ncbi:MAG: DNA-directed RNA polymerase subunit alpha [Candidatus Dojkabacteria bacterium]
MIKLDQFKVKIIEENDTSGVFEIGPLPKGFGHTLANSLRRILLSSIEGAAITAVKIDGIKHEYSTLEGLQEDIITLLLKLKELAVKMHTDEPQVLKLSVKGKKGDLLTVKAGDFEVPSEVEVVSKDLEVATLTKNTNLNIELTLEKGIGYSYADESKRKEIGIIPIDSVFSPVKRVRVEIGQARVGQYTNLDQITLEVITNGTVAPSETLLKAAEIYDELANRLVDILGGDSKLAEEMLQQEQQVEEEEEKILISELNLSTRLTNALLNAGITDLKDLRERAREEVGNFRGMGQKSLTELEEIMQEHEIGFAS